MKAGIARWRQRLRLMRHRCAGALVGRIPLGLFGRMVPAAWRIASLFSSRVRASGNARVEIGREVLGLSIRQARGASSMAFRESLIDRRIYFGRERSANEKWPDLQEISAALAQEISRLKKERDGRPVIVSPFHYVSQYANIYVIDKLRALLEIESIAVVSGVPRNMYGDDAAQIPGVKVLYTFGDEDRNGLGLRVARALKRHGVIVLFADVPPFMMHRYPTQTVGVSMFGRPARIHNGVFRLGAPFDAVLLPFCLRFERGRFRGDLFDPIPLAEPEAPQRLADCIEMAMTANYANWLPAGHPSMYAFAPSR
ncbi:hypothetical protein [Variovorax sp. GT1P44]|uniref:hypothetical protein n=1 Tax=Variovorax sp. GT1P44 TaxID=3443742 RepID=UPI003F457C30